MAYSNEVIRFGSRADGAIVANRFLTIGSINNTVAQAAAGEKILGIADDNADDTRGITVINQGQSKVECGGVVTLGAKLKSDADGKALVAAADNDEYGAVALEAGVNTQIIAVMIEKGQRGA